MRHNLHSRLPGRFLRANKTLTCGLALLAGALGAQPARAALAGGAGGAGGIEFFEAKVRPVLVEKCYRCHSTSADKLKAGLFLDSREGVLKGGETGPAIVPGHPEKSLLIEAIRYTNQDMQMPPKTRLPASEVADLSAWVQMGAPMPATPAGARPLTTGSRSWVATSNPATMHNLAGVLYSTLRREHWAWQPIRPTAAPAASVASWARTDVDRFLLPAMQAKGLHPVGDADRTTLIRRATFDLTGLPPTPAETAAFVADASPDAFAKVVDRLLASPRFGERWGRHWLDVARYAESTGSARNVPYSYAWRYRDYVIDSFNRDTPYNKFILEQIAGDLLPASGAAQRDEHEIATGFLALGVKDLNERDRLKFTMDNVDEQIDVVSKSMLGLTMSCARCHDHKFDPIPTADYYALAGVFKSTEILAGVQQRRGGKGALGDLNQLIRLDPLPAMSKPALRGPLASARASADVGLDTGRIGRLQAKLEKAEAELAQLRHEAKNELGGRRALRPRLVAKRDEIAEINREIDAVSGAAVGLKPAGGSVASGGLNVGGGLVPSPGLSAAGGGGYAMGVADGSPIDARICTHGDTNDLGPTEARAMPSIVRFPMEPTIDRSHSGRLQLAEWIADPRNPLTSRVMVNRIWEHLFGAGLVRTPDNFGTSGEAPSNPALLDSLAAQYVRDGWSTKRMIRSLMLTRAYQLASTYDSADAGIDPADRLVWRMTPRRLEAEAIRDAMLSASGELTLTRPAASPVAALPVEELRRLRPETAEEMAKGTYRSVYLPVLRSLVPPVLDVFDFAEPDMVTGDRQVTTVATQALFLMNDPFVLDQSRHMADRLLAERTASESARVDLAYRLALSRLPSAGERARALQYVTGYARDDVSTGSAGANPRADAWASLCQALFCSAEFRYVN